MCTSAGLVQGNTHCVRSNGHALPCLQEFPWIATEKEFFGKVGSDYDFEAQDVQAAFEEYEAANQSLQRLANKVNRKVCHAWLSTPSHPPCFDRTAQCHVPQYSQGWNSLDAAFWTVHQYRSQTEACTGLAQLAPTVNNTTSGQTLQYTLQICIKLWSHALAVLPTLYTSSKLSGISVVIENVDVLVC